MILQLRKHSRFRALLVASSGWIAIDSQEEWVIFFLFVVAHKIIYMRLYPRLFYGLISVRPGWMVWWEPMAENALRQWCTCVCVCKVHSLKLIVTTTKTMQLYYSSIGWSNLIWVLSGKFMFKANMCIRSAHCNNRFYYLVLHLLKSW